MTAYQQDKRRGDGPTLILLNSWKPSVNIHQVFVISMVFCRKRYFFAEQYISIIRLHVLCSLILDLHCLQQVLETRLAAKGSTLYQATKFWPWPNWKHLQMTNLVMLKWLFVSHIGKKTLVEKGENAGYQHFLCFPSVFSKVFFCRAVKTRDYLGKG